MRISNLSVSYVHCKVTDLLSDTDPTEGVPKFAFVEVGAEPESLDFVNGDWATVDGDNYARTLVGPDTSHELAVGNHDVWLKIDLTPEIPAEKIGRITIS